MIFNRERKKTFHKRPTDLQLAADVSRSDAIRAGRQEVHSLAQLSRPQPRGHQHPVATQVKVAEARVPLPVDAEELGVAIQGQGLAQLAVHQARLAGQVEAEGGVGHATRPAELVHWEVLLGGTT